MASAVDNGVAASDMPQWKRDLILRRRQAQAQASQDKAQQGSGASISKQLERADCIDCAGCAGSASNGGGGGGGGGCASVDGAAASVALGCRPPLGHQPRPAGSVGAVCGACSCSSARVRDASGSRSALPFQTATATCCECKRDAAAAASMVHLYADSDSTEELQYGPGIVSKLKNRYLSLTLREAVIKRRPSILRKSTSLENLLDGDAAAAKRGESHAERPARLFESRANGASNGTGGSARNVPPANRYRSAARGSMKRARSVEAISRLYSPAAGKEEPPPAAGLLTNGRPKSLLHEHGVDTALSAANPIITPRLNKPKRLAPVITEREKPPADVVRQAKRIFEARPEARTRPPQHTGEVAAKVATYKTIIIQAKQAHAGGGVGGGKPPLKQKPSAATLPSPIPDVSMVAMAKPEDEEDRQTLSETPDLILHSSPVRVQREREREPQQGDAERPPVIRAEASPPPPSPSPSPAASHPTSDAPSPPAATKTEPLTLDIAGAGGGSRLHAPCASVLNNRDPVLVLSPREIEKNAINAACSPGVITAARVREPPPATPEAPTHAPAVAPPAPPKAKTRKSKQAAALPEQNCVVFKFTDRKDVPDYIGNDGRLRTQNAPMPKAGEGGITLLPGATIQDVFDEELLSLEGPPSPCDVQFINDNVLIDGKSSLSKKSKRSKLRIQFVEAIPQVFEYPSEASMLGDDCPSLNQPLGGTTVPSLSGSTLANYTPRVAANEFQLGVTKAPPPPPPTHADALGKEDEDVIEHDAPMLFSSGTNADILF